MGISTDIFNDELICAVSSLHSSSHGLLFVVDHSVDFRDQYFAIQEMHGTQYLGTFPFCQSLNTSEIKALQQASSRRKNLE
jgi:hypothetical protein